jgi:hypothetical protein
VLPFLSPFGLSKSDASTHDWTRYWGAGQIDSDAYLLTVCRYVALNPVRAGMCGTPSDWPWSSYRASAKLATAPSFLSEARLREAFGGRRNWRERYREFVETSEIMDSAPVEEMLHF